MRRSAMHRFFYGSILANAMPNRLALWELMKPGILHWRRARLRAPLRRLGWALILVTASLSFAQGGSEGPAGTRAPGAAPATHPSAIVVDTHADTPMRITDENFDLATDAGIGHWDLARAKAGNLGAEFFSIYVEPKANRGHYARRAMDMIDAVYQVVGAHPNEIVMAFSAGDIVAAHAGPHPRIASLLGIEGGHAIEGDMRLLRDFYRLGVRYMTLTWATSNELGQSSGDLAAKSGTSRSACGDGLDCGLTGFRPGGGAGDEPAGDDGGHLARLGPVVLRYIGGVRGRR